MTSNKLKTVELLIIEDNPGDVRLIKEILKESELSYRFHVVEEGDLALDFLYRRGNHIDAPKPDLILLDWNLPKKEGKFFLSKIKKTVHLRNIPIIVFTSSNAEKDVLTAYDLHANCYINKPIDLDHYTKVIKSIEQFWLKIVSLPPYMNDEENIHEHSVD